MVDKDKESPRLLGFIIMSLFFGVLIALLFRPYIDVTFLTIYLISTTSFITAYLLLSLRIYRIRAFYVALISLFLLGIANYFFNKVEFALPDPKKYAAAYIVFGVLIGIAMSIGFIYAISNEE